MSLHYEQNENDILNKLLPEYVSVYRIELNSGEYEILQLVDNTNARTLVDEGSHVFGTFDEFAKAYEENFILPEEKEEFTDWFTCRNMKRRLQNTEKITYHYHSVSKEGKHRFYEAYAVKGQVDEGQFHIFLAFRNIDSILYKEKAIQKQLQDTLEKVKLSNEIISSIARTYQYISRIDIQADYFEEINNRDTEHLDFIKSGKLSENNEKVFRQYVAEEYQEAVARFEESEPGHYDVILMDIMMPNLNGWDATRKIRSMKRPDASNVPIIAMSANTFAEDIINSRISGMNRHLPKPMDEKKLLETVKECIMFRDHS